jgi:hypothetical protein
MLNFFQLSFLSLYSNICVFYTKPPFLFSPHTCTPSAEPCWLCGNLCVLTFYPPPYPSPLLPPPPASKTNSNKIITLFPLCYFPQGVAALRRKILSFNTFISAIFKYLFTDRLLLTRNIRQRLYLILSTTTR